MKTVLHTRCCLAALFIAFSFFLNAQEAQLKREADTLRALVQNMRYDSCTAQADRLISKALEEKNGHFRIYAMRLKASCLTHLNKTKEAVDLYYEALKLCDETEDKQRAYICNGLGLIYYQQEHYNEAIKYFREEIDIRRKLKDSSAQADCLINLASLYLSQKAYDSAAHALRDVRRFITPARKALTGYYYLASGTYYQSLKNNDSAIVNYQRSLKVWLDLNNKREALKAIFDIGNVYKDRHEPKQALPYYHQALGIAQEIKSSYDAAHIYGSLALLYEDVKDFKSAAEYYSKYINLKDSLQKEEIDSYVIKLDKQYRAEQSRELIHKQQLEIAEQQALLSAQSKRTYLILLISTIIIVVFILIFVYYNFRKRLDKEIEEAKKKFFSNVVHEIRTPLTMIQAPLKLLRSKLSAPEEISNIETAERNVTRLNELINQMLDISKLESARYALNESVGNLGDFFSQLSSTYSKLAAEKNISFVQDLHLQGSLLYFDKDALEKIFGNLLGNAVKYTPSGGRVGIEAYTEEQETGVMLNASVWDTGPGIPEKEQEKIFSRFYRSSSTSAGTKGVGIGLSLVKELIDVYHGSIELKSKGGQGATFSVTILLRPPEEAVKPTETGTQGKAQLLLAEDDAEILNFNTGLLKANNYEVLAARNGKEALMLLGKTLPDLIITDLMMPELDGLGLLKSIRANTETNHIPVIILSAKASPKSRMEALQSGAQAYLAKPFLPDELLSLVNNQVMLLDRRKNDFRQQIEQPEKKTEEKFTGIDPYTQKLISLIFQKIDDPDLSVEGLAALMATNRSHFQRKVKALLGLSPSDLIKTIRLEKAKEMLLGRRGNITEVAYQTGFSSQSYFTKCFTQHFGISPTQMLHGTKKSS